MQTFLTLCVRAREEAGIAGSGPSTVIGQSGQLLRLVNWVRQAWIDIQVMRPNWLFMHEEFNFDTTIAKRDYSAADLSVTNVALWDLGSFYIYEKSVGESDQNLLPHVSYADWQRAYRAGMNVRADERPTVFTIKPNSEIRFHSQPDKIYTIDCEYKRTAQHFAADLDEPTNLPDDFHTMIVWQALKYYGHYENAPEVLDEAETNFDSLLYRLEIEQLPDYNEDIAGLA